MKRFEYDAVKSRLIERMKMNSDAATILDDGTFSNLIDVFSEGISEIARYVEYNLMEKKWSTAVNMSSLTSMGSLIGRKRQRPKSAVGYVVVSHTDEKGVNRLQNFGSTFFNLDEGSDYDDIVQDKNADYIQKSALVPWTNFLTYQIPKGTIFTSNKGVQYIAIKTVKPRILTTAFSEIKANELKMKDFTSAGGWDGIKYLKVPVIQGIQKIYEVGTTKGDRFESFRVDIENIENASNPISKEFFYVEVQSSESSEPERWVEIQKIRMAGPYDKVFETKLSEDGTALIIKFGDGTSGYVPTKGSTITLHYLETLGASGNMEQKFQINKMAFPKNELMIDPRTNMLSTFLYCTNTSTIMGGKDIEDEDEYKTNAPTSYLSSYSTAVKDTYEKQIMENSPLSLSKITCYPEISFNATQVDTILDTDINEEVANEVNTISNSLCVSAVKSNGDKLSKEEANEFTVKIIKSLGDLKGPNDSIAYKEPNFIKIAPSLKIYSYDIDTTEDEIKKNVSFSILNEYSIFNTQFKNTLFTSNILHKASLFKFTDSVDLTLEALANISFEKDDIKVLNLTHKNDYVSYNKQGTPVLCIPFNFDKMFGSNKTSLGFKNASVESPYLLKIDLTFINGQNRNDKNRTFFLYDNRKNTDLTLEDSRLQDYTNTSDFKIDTNTTLRDAISNLGFKVSYFDETSPLFKNRSVRVAQFPYLTNITDSDFMNKAKTFTTAPFEIRPFEVDELGNNKTFASDDISDDKLKVSFSGLSESTKSCYKLNQNYIYFTDILFNEYYDDVDNINYASGYFLIPVDYFEFSSLPNWSPDNVNNPDYLTKLSELLKNYISIKIYAQPKQTNLETINSTDICFIDDDDIKVEKVQKYDN